MTRSSKKRPPWDEGSPGGPSIALRAAKKLIRSSGGLDVAAALRAEAGAQAETVASSDFQEGITAFLEKRKTQVPGQVNEFRRFGASAI